MKTKTSLSLTEHFVHYFTPVLADTTELQEEVYRIRYQVYCEELGYEPKEKFPDKMEQDEYDCQSVHYLLKHNPTGQYVGCVRVILPDLDQKEFMFPSEKISPPQIQFNRQYFCELSRLAVLKRFRQFKGHLIILGLQVIFVSIAAELNKNILYLTDPRLSSFFESQGFVNILIGPVVDFHGKRGNFLMKPSEVINNLKSDLLELFNTVRNDVRKSMLLAEYKLPTQIITQSSRKADYGTQYYDEVA